MFLYISTIALSSTGSKEEGKEGERKDIDELWEAKADTVMTWNTHKPYRYVLNCSDMYNNNIAGRLSDELAIQVSVSNIKTQPISVVTDALGRLSFDVVSVASGKGHISVSTSAGRFLGCPMSVVSVDAQTGVDGGKSQILLECSERKDWNDTTIVMNGSMYIKCGNDNSHDDKEDVLSVAVSSNGLNTCEEEKENQCKVEFQLNLIDMNGKPYTQISTISVIDDIEGVVINYSVNIEKTKISVVLRFNGKEFTSTNVNNVLSLGLSVDGVVLKDRLQLVVLVPWYYDWHMHGKIEYQTQLPFGKEKIADEDESKQLHLLVNKGIRLWMQTVARMKSNNNDVYCLGLLRAWITTIFPPFGLPAIVMNDTSDEDERTTLGRCFLFKIIVDRLRFPLQDEAGVHGVPGHDCGNAGAQERS